MPGDVETVLEGGDSPVQEAVVYLLATHLLATLLLTIPLLAIPLLDYRRPPTDD